MRIVCRVMVTVFLLESGILAQAAPKDIELVLFHLVNQERQKAGLAALRWDQHLAESARNHVHVMAQYQELSHQFPGEPELAERVRATGARFDAAGENVALAPTVEEAHRGLMNSPPHRANILNQQYNAVGLAIVLSNDELYVAQNFARVLPEYSEAQFRDAVTVAFSQRRKTNGLPLVSATADTYLQHAACSGETNPDKLIAHVPGALDLEIFTSSMPERLPAHMQEAAGNPAFQRMKIGVCFRPGKEYGYASFKVVVAFFARS